MTTITRRTFRSTPYRDAEQTWLLIVELLTNGRDGGSRKELLSVSGLTSSIIADQSPKDAPIIITCEGPRTRIYCLYDNDAIEDSNANESDLGFDPLKGNWNISLPCQKDDLSWVQNALKEYSNRITARDLETGINNDYSEEKTNSESLTLDTKGFLKL